MHTPGPWAIGLDSDNERVQVIAASGEHLCYVECDPLPDNARLIAAAPEMVALLADVQRYCPVHVQDRIRATLAAAANA